MPAENPRYSAGEEVANSITHGIGLVLAITGVAILCSVAIRSGNPWQIISYIVFAITLIVMYSFSTLYHSVQLPRLKRVLRIFDHSSIFLLIAGTYTPFMLVNLRGPWGWSLLGIVWTLAISGILIQLTHLHHSRKFSLFFYLCMGWAVVIAIKPMFRAVAPGGLILLLLGGLAYTLGVIFYSWKSLRYHHAIWHGFVLAGSMLHFFAVLFYATPRT
jgi:hemolysin III